MTEEKIIEKVSLSRVMSIILMVIATVGISVFLCLFNKLYVDEMLSILFLDILYFLVFIFHLVYERKQKRFSNNEHTTMGRVALGYVLATFVAAGCIYLPEFYKPVALFPILLVAMSSESIAIVVSMFLNILVILTVSANYFEMISNSIIILMVGLLAKKAEKKEFRIGVCCLIFAVVSVVPILLMYLSKESIVWKNYAYSAINGIVAFFVLLFSVKVIFPRANNEVSTRMKTVVSERYPMHDMLDNYSKREYDHAKRVSELSKLCAGELKLNEELCAAAGFYYRLGLWQGEPHVQAGVEKAIQLCFPEPLIQLLKEYNGEEHAISSKESAIVHMVDSVVKKVELIREEDIGMSKWNKDVIIYQTLNELSSMGLYDESGLSMNQFLKIRDILSKEALHS